MTLPDSVPVDAIKETAYSGYFGERGDNFTVSRDGRTLRFVATEPLRPLQGLTVVVSFPEGHVAHPSLVERTYWFVVDNWPLLVPLALLALWGVVWWCRGRDSLRDAVVIPEFELPEGLRPTELGVLADDRMQPRDLTAAFIDLAVRGILKIEDLGDNHRLSVDPDWPERKDLHDFERELLDSVFRGDRTETTLASLRYGFQAKYDRVRDRVMDGLVIRGFYRSRPDQVRQRWIKGTVFALVGLLLFGIFVAPSLIYFVLMVLCGAGMMPIARQMPGRTRLGREALRRIRGLEEYLETAEAECMRDLPKSEIEALLPVAVALGFYRAWAVTFAGLYETQPGWLTLPDEGRSFVGSLSSFLATSVEFTGRVRRTSFWSDWHWSDLSG